MAKDKKKKKGKNAVRSTGSALKALAENRILADVVAAALVATAAALKDSKRARALASDAGDELAKLSRAGAKQGEALWDMALQIGRRSLEAVGAEEESRPARAKKAAAKPKRVAKAKAAAGKSSKRKTASASKR